jgi:hypothetical protein
MENRRRLHRQPAGWAASYQLAGEPASGWRDCRVVDISMLGLGIMFDHPNCQVASSRSTSPGTGAV